MIIPLSASLSTRVLSSSLKLVASNWLRSSRGFCACSLPPSFGVSASSSALSGCHWSPASFTPPSGSLAVASPQTSTGEISGKNSLAFLPTSSHLKKRLLFSHRIQEGHSFLPPLTQVRRSVSTMGNPSEDAQKLHELSYDKLHVSYRIRPETPLLPPEKMVFGVTFADYMLEVDWDSQYGWHPPHIKETQNLSIHPSAATLHYGLQVFEGMKAYAHHKTKKPLLFRPEKNMSRLNKSCSRMSLPTFNEEELLKLIKHLIRLNVGFIPTQEDFSLYIRPNVFASSEALGLNMPQKAKLVVTACPSAGFFSNVSSGVSEIPKITLLAETKFARSYPGSVGDVKAGGNYGPTIYPQKLAASHGANQILWLYATQNDFMITEAGAMNIFLHWINEQGQEELITPAIERNLILPGITRDSILTLAKDIDGLKVTEGEIFMKQFVRAFDERRLLGCFSAGTAVVVSPVGKIIFNGREMSIADGMKENAAGNLYLDILKRLKDIYYGVVDHSWSVEC